MIDVKDIISYFESKNVNFFTGVPDSQLSSFCDYVEENCENIIAANETIIVIFRCPLSLRSFGLCGIGGMLPKISGSGSLPACR